MMKNRKKEKNKDIKGKGKYWIKKEKEETGKYFK